MTDELKQFFGRNVSYAESKFDIYNKLMKDVLSPFRGKTMADIFVYAAVFGFNAGRQHRIEPKEKKPQISATAMTQEQKATLLTIAIEHTGSIDILFEEEKAAEIVEGYANMGIDLLEDKMLGGTRGDFISMLASSMRKEIKLHQSKTTT